MYQVIFAVRCETCNQMLEATASSEGTEFRHGNVEDCNEPGVTLPFVSVEDFTKLLGASSAKAKPKSTSKKKGK